MKNLCTLQTENRTAVQRLTALWALSESGLGGIMFALKIPFTGFFVGGFAVILISIIAWFSKGNYKTIVQATVLVIMIKALVSPHSPPPAYFAVAFQGLTGALLFRMISSYKTACILLGILSMAESAMQKIIVLTIIFGKGLWEAVNGLFINISRELSLNIHMSYTMPVITCYVILYAFWGIIVGSWASKLPAEIETHKEEILTAFKVISAVKEMDSPEKKKSKKIKRLIFFFTILMFIIIVFIWSGAESKQILWVLLRSIAAILLLFFVLQPVMKYFLKKWLDNRSAEKKRAAGDMMEMLPKLRTYINPAYRLALAVSGPFKKMKYFVLYLIILALYGE